MLSPSAEWSSELLPGGTHAELLYLLSQKNIALLLVPGLMCADIGTIGDHLACKFGLTKLVMLVSLCCSEDFVTRSPRNSTRRRSGCRSANQISITMHPAYTLLAYTRYQS